MRKLPPRPTAPVAPDSNVKDTLDFAVKMADFEIKSIDRLHIRFLWFIGIAVTVFLAFLTALGFLGYNNLRSLATEAAASQLKSEVTKQINQKLTSENLPGIVRDEVRSYSAGELRQQVSRELRSGPLHNQVVSTAREQSSSIIGNLFQQRTLKPENAKRITKAIDDDDELDDVGYLFYPDFGSPETLAFLRQLAVAFDDSKLTGVVGPGSVQNDNRPTGVTIYASTGMAVRQDSFSQELLKLGATLLGS